MRVIVKATKVQVAGTEEASLIVDSCPADLVYQDGEPVELIQMELVNHDCHSGDIFRVSLSDLKKALRVFE